MDIDAGRPRRMGAIAIGWIASCVLAPPALCDSSGLNNIPTADTTPDRTIVFQFRSSLGDEVPAEYFGGFKMGLEPLGHRFEWGVDGQAGVSSIGEDAGPAVLQFKLALDLTETTAIGVGVAAIGVRERDRDDVGQPFKYAVLSHDFGSFRGHGGYGFRQEGNTVLLGLDTTVPLFGRELVLRSDLIQIDDEDQFLGSVGALYAMTDFFIVETWMSQPFEHGEPRFVLKLNFAVTF